MDLSFETLATSKPEPGILVVTMNRPQALNAMNTLMMTELRDCFTALYGDQRGVNCVVLTGAGNRGFCAGADLKAVAAEEGTSRCGIPANRWKQLAHRGLA